MQIRLKGTKGECAVAVQLLSQVLTVLSADERPLRGESLEVFTYMEVRIPGQHDQAGGGPGTPAPTEPEPAWTWNSRSRRPRLRPGKGE